MMINLYNTLSRQKEVFQPINEAQVKIYTCGPTVYNYAHIGNLRAYIFADILHRLFAYHGYKVTPVINITDVGHLTSDADSGTDRIEEAVKRDHQSVDKVIKHYTDVFFTDLDKLNIDRTNIIFPRATEHIQEQIDLIKKLETKGFTYLTSDGVYFDTSKYVPYPELAKLDLKNLKAGARVEINIEKKNPTDFALWKFSKPSDNRTQEWRTPWGTGFPGWHIECSAMSMKYLGEHFDIHTGGIDHIPVHHTNERAQSESATGKPFVNYWLHNAFVTVDDKKMAKREDGFITLNKLEESGFSPIAYRYLTLTVHYRKNMNFTDQALTGAQQALNKLLSKAADLGEAHGEIIPAYKKLFTKAIDDDLNTAEALALVWQLIDDEKVTGADKKATVIDFDKVLGLGLATAKKITIPEAVQKLVNKREEARKANDWPTADRLRTEIDQTGFNIDDTPTGPILNRK